MQLFDIKDNARGATCAIPFPDGSLAYTSPQQFDKVMSILAEAAEGDGMRGLLLERSCRADGLS